MRASGCSKDISRNFMENIWYILAMASWNPSLMWMLVLDCEQVFAQWMEQNIVEESPPNCFFPPQYELIWSFTRLDEQRNVEIFLNMIEIDMAPLIKVQKEKIFLWSVYQWKSSQVA